MRIKIRKYQQGGGVMASIYQPVTTTSGASGVNTAQYAINLLNSGTTGGGGGSSSSSSDKGKITEKDLYTGLYKTIAEQGLISDSQYIISQLQNDLFNESLTNPFGDTSDLTGKYIKALSYVNMAKSNQKLYDETYKQSVANGSLQEAAITSDGKIVVKTNAGQLTTISPEQYKKNPDNYHLMTNGNLLAERMNNPSQAFKNGILEVVQNGTSQKEIAELIKDFVGKLGSTDNELTGYTSVKDGQIQKGVALLQAAAQKYGEAAVADMISVDGLYKVGITDKSSQEQVQLAIQSVYQMLTPAQQTLLQIKSADGTKRGAYQLIAGIISTGASSNFKLDIDLESGVDADGNRVGRSASSGGGSDDSKSSLITNIQRSIGGNEQTYVLNPGGTAELSVTGTYYGQLSSPDGKPIGKTSLEDMLSKSKLQSVSDVKSIYFGDQRISPDKLSDVTYENQGATKVLLPAVGNESLWRPNFEYLDKYEEAAKAVRARGLNPNDEGDENAMKALAEELEKLGLYDLIDRTTGLPNTRLVRPFLVTTGYASTKAGIKGSKYLQEITDEGIINEFIDTLSTKEGNKVQKYDLDTFSIFNPLDWGIGLGGSDTVYRGTIYIPINTNELSGITASGQHIKSAYAQAREAEYQNSWKRLNAQTTTTDVLK